MCTEKQNSLQKHCKYYPVGIMYQTKLIGFNKSLFQPLLKQRHWQKWVNSANPWLNCEPTIGFTSSKIDLSCHFQFTQLGFLGVYFKNTLDKWDMFLDEEI